MYIALETTLDDGIYTHSSDMFENEVREILHTIQEIRKRLDLDIDVPELSREMLTEIQNLDMSRVSCELLKTNDNALILHIT